MQPCDQWLCTICVFSGKMYPKCYAVFVKKYLLSRLRVFWGYFGEHFPILTPLMGLFNNLVHFLLFSWQFTSLCWVN